LILDNQTPIIPQIVSGFKRRTIRLRMMLRIVILALRRYRGLGKALLALKQIIVKRRKIHGNKFVLKYVRADGRYFAALNVPGWPSKAFDSFIKSELDKSDDIKQSHHNLHTAIFSITSRCSYHCEHCYEWSNISSEEILSIEELQIIQQKLHDQGICHLQYSGGEPLSRIDALIDLLSKRKADVDYWILSSGYKMTFATAKSLKDNGLTGAVISLDHWEEEAHNAFRKHPKSFYWAREAVIQCKRAKLATGLSICATREFISKQNLWRYADLAKSWGVGFIRILEPRQIGNYKGEDVHLSKGHIEILETFFLEINSKRAHRKYPIVMYPGYHQREVGCVGAGNRYIYIDSKGDIHACPFCQDQRGNALKDSLNDSIGSLQETGCHQFISNLVE
jgi:MoaA/NifB/PqqE/SkfB family radical SAM enzyme